MGVLASEVRRLVYTVICFQCLLQLMEGSAYRKYLKLFSYLMTMCICCNVIFSFVGQVEHSLKEADEIYAEWEKEWRAMTGVDDIRQGNVYYEQKLWEDRILNEAYREYGSTEGGGRDEGRFSGEDRQVP